MPGHIHAPMPGPMPYPWMQRPMPGHMAGPAVPPGMQPGSSMQPLMPAPWTPEMGPMDLWAAPQWTMPQWNRQMWEPDMEEDPDETKDMEYWRQLYPEQTRRIQQEVSHQCDLMDYEGSVMYDEYPDRIALSRICESIYNALMRNGVIGGQSRPNQEFINGNRRPMDDEDYMDDNDYSDDISMPQTEGQNYDPIDSVDMMQYRQPGRRPSRSLQDLIEVLLYQEMHQRRRRRRRNRRWW